MCVFCENRPNSVKILRVEQFSRLGMIEISRNDIFRAQNWHLKMHLQAFSSPLLEILAKVNRVRLYTLIVDHLRDLILNFQLFRAKWLLNRSMSIL